MLFNKGSVTCAADESVYQVWQSNNARARQASYDDLYISTALALSRLWGGGIRREDPRSASVRIHGGRVGFS